MLKPSHKKIQNAGIKKDGKIDAQEQLKLVPRFLELKKKRLFFSNFYETI